MENRTNSNISHQIPARVIEADSSLARDIRLKRLRMIDTLVAKHAHLAGAVSRLSRRKRQSTFMSTFHSGKCATRPGA